MADSPVIVGAKHGDPRAWVPLVDWENEHAMKKIYQSCLMDISERMNKMVDEIEARRAGSWTDETAPAPLDTKEAP